MFFPLRLFPVRIPCFFSVPSPGIIYFFLLPLCCKKMRNWMIMMRITLDPTNVLIARFESLLRRQLFGGCLLLIWDPGYKDKCEEFNSSSACPPIVCQLPGGRGRGGCLSVLFSCWIQFMTLCHHNLVILSGISDSYTQDTTQSSLVTQKREFENAC